MNRLVLALVIVAFLSACATPRLGAIPAGDRLLVEAEPDRYGGRYPVQIRIASRGIGKGVRVGAGAGAALGMVGGLACGPAVIFCGPALGLLLGTTGALTGAAVGAGVVSVTSQLPENVESAIAQKAHAYAGGDALADRLISAVRAKLHGRWTVVPENAPTRIRLRLDSITLDVDTEQRLALAVRATATLERTDRTRHSRPESRTYEFSSVASHHSAWAEDRDGIIDESFRAACEHVASAIHAELAR